jgi:nuclear transport factor 2 (NTF2) superfamily protein
MRTIGITALWLLFTTVLAAGDETKPDLSGTWELNPVRSRLEMTAPTKSTFWIEHYDGRFKLTRTHVWDGRWDTLSFEFPTDGEEHYKKSGQSESWTRMFWVGEELVLDMKLAYGGEQGTNVVHYRLADGGKTFVAAEWSHMPRKQHHNLWVFDRVPAAQAASYRDRVKDFAERYTAAWGSQDPSIVAAFFSEDGSLRVNDGEPAIGRDAIAAIAREFMTALPDMVLHFDGLEGRDGRILFHWTLEATNSGPGGTGNKVRVSGYESWRLDEDGLIAESQGNFPTAEYERQLEVGYDDAALSE